MFMMSFRSVSMAVMVAVLILTTMPLGFVAASNSQVTLTAQYLQDEVVVLDFASNIEISSLDPAVASDVVSLDSIENLFHGLTDVDPYTSQIVPELATGWEFSADGTVWTFQLRDDVMWMRYDSVSDTAETLRPVVAQDVVYGIQRTCDPRLGGYYGTIAAGVIAGCDAVNGAPESDLNDEYVFGDTVQVSAPDDTTLIIELQFAAGYFFSMTPMWILRPVPQEAINEFGDEWTMPGNIITNGPYFLQENTRGVRRVFVRNHAHNPALDYGGNVDVINVSIIEDEGTIFALYQDAQVDATGVPSAELQSILTNSEYTDQLYQVFDLAVFYFNFAYDKEPFDNVHVRRAFSAIIDRHEFVNQILQGRGIPMIHFTPPGMAHAPPINEVGVGFDPIYAQAQLAEAGYENCNGLPNISMLATEYSRNWVDYWASAAEEHLGCSLDLFTVETVEFSVMIQLTAPDSPTQDRVNAWAISWLPDYADANNWVGDVLACDTYNSIRRPCSEVDDLIEAAGRSSDPTERDALYLEIEDAFFGVEGEYPIAPLYMRADYVLRQAWYTGPFDTDGLFAGSHWDTWQVDMEAKLTAQD